MRKAVTLWVNEVLVLQLEQLAATLGIMSERGPGAGRLGSVSALVSMIGRATMIFGPVAVAGYLQPLRDALAANDAECARHAQTGE